jgi:general secretion pathway protein B
MSIILDALKKLDREKSSRRNAAGNIAIEILRPDLPRPGKRIPLYFAAISLTAVATAVVTYAVMVEFGFLSKSSVPASINPPATSQQAAPVPLDSSSLSKSSPPVPMNPSAPSQQVAPAPLSHEPVRDTQDEISRVPPKIQGHAESKDPVTFPTEKKVDRKVIPEEAIVAPEKTITPTEHTPTPAQQIPKEFPTTPPSLKVSAIVWYEEPSKRFAMINGVIANEGSVIEGVKVEEIYPNRVRFSYNDRLFEIAIK